MKGEPTSKYPCLSARPERNAERLIRALIVDDEPLARRAVRVRLGREPDIRIVGEATDGNEAVDAIRSLHPDLVFLDVQMPGMNGFQVLEQISDDLLPMVVFVTAHDVHVLRAFEIHALDYLLKPYSESRFSESLRRARREILRGGAFPERAKLGALLEQLDASRDGGAAPVYPRRFAVREGDRIVLVKATDLEAVEAAGNYVMLVTRHHKHLLRLTLAEMERQLDPARFVRIHRSTIVNTDLVHEIRLDPHGDCDLSMENGATYRLSRAHRDRLLAGYGGSIR
jgi:two-component system LytT family response regulator